MHRVHELLARLDALDRALTNDLDAHALDQVARNLEVHVRLEQGRAHGFEPLFDVLVGELALAAQGGEGGAEPVTQGFEHGGEEDSGALFLSHLGKASERARRSPKFRGDFSKVPLWASVFPRTRRRRTLSALLRRLTLAK